MLEARYASLCAVLLCVLPSVDALGQDRANAMQVIRETAKDICASIPLTVQLTTAEASVAVQAKLAGVVKKLADAGVEAAGKYSSSSSQRGIVEADILPALRDQNSCRLHIFDKLIDKFLPERQASVVIIRDWDLLIPSGGSTPGYRISSVRLAVDDAKPSEFAPLGFSEPGTMGFKYAGFTLRVPAGDHDAKFEIDYNLISENRQPTITISCSVVLRAMNSMEFTPNIRIGFDADTMQIKVCKLTA